MSNILIFRSPKKMKPDYNDRNEQARSIRLPDYIWQAVDEDARRCRRSSVKHIEALLIRYFDLEPSVEMDETKLTQVASVESLPRKKA